MIEQEVSIPSGDITLSGTLCSPTEKGTFPTVLWLQGSGPLDRDDNVPGQALNNSKIIAHHLAQHGIASLRFDKRGIRESGGDYYTAGHSDLVDDGVNCLTFLENHRLCDSTKLFAIGHSEGAIIAPQLAQRYEGLAGIILLCPFVEDPEKLLLRQAHQMKEMMGLQTGIKSVFPKILCAIFDPVKQQAKIIKKFKLTEKKTGRIWFAKQPFYWWKQLLALDPKDIIAKTSVPTLAIGGAKDVQALPSDVYAIKALIKGQYECHIIEDMSHILRNEPEQASVFNYAQQLTQPIEPEVLRLIQAWLERRTKNAN